MSKLAPKRPPIEPCACCGKPSELDVWQYRLCLKCHGRWVVEVGPPPCWYEVPTITTRPDGKREATWKTPQNERNQQWCKATEGWLQKAKARAA